MTRAVCVAGVVCVWLGQWVLWVLWVLRVVGVMGMVGVLSVVGVVGVVGFWIFGWYGRLDSVACFQAMVWVDGGGHSVGCGAYVWLS